MTNIGRQELSRAVSEEILKQLLATLTHPNKGRVRGLLLGLLTKTEQIMLAKRFAAILMLIEDHSYYRIHQILGMSTSTLKNLHHALLTGEYADIELQVMDKKQQEELRRKIGLLLRGGLPPRSYVIKKRKQ